MPYIHRFRPAKFSQRSLEELNANRDYWGPWLFLQIVYHTAILLLNHPLLLSLRLRNFKAQLPEIFLQHTADMVSSHAVWVIRLIEMVDGKGFKVTDPFLAYCVAIVATIYLQESFVEDPETRQQKKEDFHKCLTFVRGMGEEWPHVSRIVSLLPFLASRLVKTVAVHTMPLSREKEVDAPKSETWFRIPPQKPKRRSYATSASFQVASCMSVFRSHSPCPL